MSPNVDDPIQIIYGNQNWYSTYRGVAPEYLAIRRWTVARGASFTHQDSSYHMYYTIDAIKELYTINVEPDSMSLYPQGYNPGANGFPVMISNVTYGARVLANLDITFASSSNTGGLDFQYTSIGSSAFANLQAAIAQKQCSVTINGILVGFPAKFPGTFSTDNKNAKSLGGRLLYSPTIGTELGGSFYWGRYTPEFLPDEKVYTLAGDGATNIGPIQVQGEFAYTRFDGIENVAAGFARKGINSESENENGNTEVAFNPPASSSLGCGTPCATERFSYDRNNFGIEGDWRFDRQNRFFAGYDYNHINRERVDFD